jgi:hypothetical protein
MAVFVDESTSKPEVPIDQANWTVQLEVGKTGLFGGLAKRGVGGRLVFLQMPFGEAPIVVGVPDQEKPHHPSLVPAEHDAAGGHLALRPPFTHEDHTGYGSLGRSR